MGEVLAFEKGCHRCANLVRSGQNTYMCLERVHMDDSSVMPVVDGKHTEDWNICRGDDYKYLSNKYSKMS